MSHESSQGPVATLKGVVDEVLLLFQSRMQRQGVWVNTDVPAEPYPSDKRSMKLTIYQMVADALEQMPTGGDLFISAFVDAHMVELEVADSAVTDRPGLQEVGALEALATQCGGRMRWIHCAQGGTARVLQISQQRKRAAA